VRISTTGGSCEDTVFHAKGPTYRPKTYQKGQPSERLPLGLVLRNIIPRPCQTGLTLPKTSPERSSLPKTLPDRTIHSQDLTRPECLLQCHVREVGLARHEMPYLDHQVIRCKSDNVFMHEQTANSTLHESTVPGEAKHARQQAEQRGGDVSRGVQGHSAGSDVLRRVGGNSNRLRWRARDKSILRLSCSFTSGSLLCQDGTVSTAQSWEFAVTVNLKHITQAIVVT